MSGFWKNNKWRILLIGAGVVLSILFFSIGFWRTLLLLLIVAVCYFIGALLDAGGVENLKSTLDVLLNKKK